MRPGGPKSRRTFRFLQRGFLSVAPVPGQMGRRPHSPLGESGGWTVELYCCRCGHSPPRGRSETIRRIGPRGASRGVGESRLAGRCPRAHRGKPQWDGHPNKEYHDCGHPCPSMPPHLMLRCGRVGKEPAQRLLPRARPGSCWGTRGARRWWRQRSDPPAPNARDGKNAFYAHV